MKNNLVSTPIWLFIGLLFLFFSNGKYSFALAAWLFPIFILAVSRRQRCIYSYLVIPFSFGIVTQFSFWKFSFDNPSNILFYIPFFFGVLMGLIFLVDRLLYPRWKGFTATLIFPLTYTSFDFLSNLFNPFGTTGVLGYSQYEFLSFSQLVSVTGMWGLTFMITWFGSVVYWVIENNADKKIVIKGSVIYLIILLGILTYGGLRLAIPYVGKTVKISGIHTHDKNKEGVLMWKSLNEGDTIQFKRINEDILQKLIKNTILESNAGSKMVVWSEISLVLLASDEADFKSRIRNLAKEQGIYISVSPFVIHQSARSENKMILFSPEGDILSTHYKYGGNFLEGTVEGDKEIKTIKTPYGNVSNLICWDADFPSIVRQVEKKNTDILFIPASDWKEIDPLHTIVAVFRGIENGCSVIRQTRNGLSIMTDPRGKIITQKDHFSANSWVMSGNVPTKGMWTLYPVIGDLFGWLSMIGLLFFIYQYLKISREI